MGGAIKNNKRQTHHLAHAPHRQQAPHGTKRPNVGQQKLMETATLNWRMNNRPNESISTVI